MNDAVALPAGAGPGARYRTGIEAGQWQADPAQFDALVHFDRLARELAVRDHGSWWQRLRQRSHAAAPSGIYLWGRVGRGKTFLADLFFDATPLAAKRRVHFHRFMQEVHAQLKMLEGHSDPLAEVAARIAAESRLVCLDELHVGDIGDAMILGNLLAALFARGVVLVTTSNVPPGELYKDGLQRERFLPAIALIERRCTVLELASPHDYRLRALKQAPVYHTPPGATAERALAACFERVAPGPARERHAISVNDRSIPVRREADGAIWFDFAALCDGPRGVADYIELGRAFHTVLVSCVPQFTPQTEDPARRFVELVDEFYDRGVKLILSAATPIVDLYDGTRLRAEFARTESRLIEMQSEDYLARPHRG